MDATAVVIQEPKRLALSRLAVTAPGPEDVVVDVAWTGVSTGTERLLWSGRMPPFPGMGYPLVPGYETVGRVVAAGPDAGVSDGALVFVPGARCFPDARCLFGGAASRVVSPGDRVAVVDDAWGERGVLLALAATAYHAIDPDRADLPELIVGHGVLGRLIARIAVALGAAPVVWEINPARSDGAEGYTVAHPDADDRRDYRVICDVSGDGSLLNGLIARLALRGEVVLAGFYEQPVAFDFPPAFIKQARLRVAAEWDPADLAAVNTLVGDGRLSLDGLITHRCDASEAEQAYATAFEDAHCLKMVLDWRTLS